MHPAELKVNAAIDACRPHLTDEEYKLVSEWSIRHGEYRLAIETLADILGENETKATADQLALIAEAFAVMDTEPGRRFQYLCELSGLAGSDGACTPPTSHRK